MLTTKVQQDFEKWLYNNIEAITIYTQIGDADYEFDHEFGDMFDDLPLSAQFGIYQDYFWNRYRYWLEIYPVLYDNWEIEIIEVLDLEQQNPKTLYYECDYETSDQARQTAIKEASELAEKRL